MSVPGFVEQSTGHGFFSTIAHLKAAVEDKGSTLFARIDRAAGAAAAGMTLWLAVRPAFGSAIFGTRLIQASPTVASDLPQEMLVLEDISRKTWLGYNDPHWLAVRPGAEAALHAALHVVACMRALPSGLDQQVAA